MSYPQFALYNVTGAFVWVGLCVGAGYAFGTIPAVKHNFEFVVVAVVFISLLPIAWGYIISRLQRDAPAIVKAKEL
jgi:membrane-associated protein